MQTEVLADCPVREQRQPVGEIPESLRLIRNRWPVARCDAKTWAEIQRLALTEDPKKIKQAEELARKCILEHPRLRARHDGAVTARIKRREFLVVQRERERLIADALSAAAARMAGAISRFSADDGKISPGRLKALLTRLDEINSDAYKAINSEFLAILRTAAAMGLKSAMAQAERVVDRARAVKAAGAAEGAVDSDTGLPAGHWLVSLVEDVDPLRAKVSYSATSTVFKRLFKGALKATMAAGIFGKSGVSNRVWDLRDQNFLTLKRLVAGGIARGESAAKISRDVRGLLHQPSTLYGDARDDARPGPGVYRSAYKNAMRLTRTESNRAYVGAESLFAAEKGWMVVWQVSSGQRDFDSCDFLNGRIMTPEEFADEYPVHPNCLLPDVLVSAPDIVAAAKSFYDGGVIEIRLVGGRRLTVTENHPILTPSGWMAAKFLRKGSQVIVASDVERITKGINPYNHNGPARIEQVFDTFRMARGVSAAVMEHSAEDFHGDGRSLNGEINIVWADRLLGRYRKAFLEQPVEKTSFNRRYKRVISPATLGDFAPMREGMFPTTHGLKCPGGNAPFFRSRHLGRTQILGSLVAAKRHAHGQQSFAEITAGDSKFNGTCEQRVSGNVSVLDSRDVRFFDDTAMVGSRELCKKALATSSGPDACRNKLRFQNEGASSEPARQFVERFSGDIKTARVTEIRARKYRGHVYDLQADVFGLYIANGVFVKNCLCYSSIVVPEVG